jgi:hypothetical protein
MLIFSADRPGWTTTSLSSRLGSIEQSPVLLTVPPNAPIEQYWSVTAYDRQTHALIKNMNRASRASNNTEVKKNADGSVDIYFGPKALAGEESNWVPTDPARKFELMFRANAPAKTFFEKMWKLPDVEEVK